MRVKFIITYTLCLLFYIGFSNTDKYRLILNDDPATTITIAWNQIAPGINPVVYYDTIDHGTNYTMYNFSKTEDRAVLSTGMDNRFARLTGLTPNTNYYFIIKDSESTSQRFWFKTAPNDTSRLSFIAGGDSRNNRVPRQNANLLVSKLKPHAVLFGGDMTDDDTNIEWQEWFDDWQLTTATDGRMFPIIATRGNHEYDSERIYKLFDTPNTNSYYAVTFGDNLVRAYTLNTEISVLGDQKTWLENDLAVSSGIIWKMAQYHKPMRSHTSSKPEGDAIYGAWAQLFYDQEVRLVVECDSHMSKTTWPVMPSSASGNDEGFINEQMNGTVYTGEGCWGAPLRPNNDLKSWTRNSGTFNQFKLIFVDTETIELRTIKVNNASDVGENSNSDPFTLPTNLDVFTPEPGEDVVVIYKDPPCTITNLSAGTQGACDSSNDTYTQDIVVSYFKAPTSGFLEVNGQSFTITSSPQTVTLTGLSSDGLDVDATANFTAISACTFTLNNLFEAPSNCSNGGLPDNSANEGTNIALFNDATLSGNVVNGRGIPEHILYDPIIDDYAVVSNYNEYGVNFGTNIGTPNVDEGINWQVNWTNSKSLNYITFGGAYSNQPQANTMWRISYRNNGSWTILDEGQGGWINSGIFEWGGLFQTPIIADALRVQLYSDGSNEVVSIHLRGRGGVSSLENDSTTTPKATLLQYLSIEDSCGVTSLPANTELYCKDEWQNGDGPDQTTSTTNFMLSNGTFIVDEDENLKVNDFTILNSASVVIKQGGSITVNGDLDNNGSLLLESVSNKYSSLIVKGTSEGQISYKRHINAFTANNDLITPPVKGEKFGAFEAANPNIFANPNLNDQKLFGPFNKTIGEYDTYFSNTGSPDLDVTLGNGLAYRTARDGTKDGTYGTTFIFTGAVVTDDVLVTIIESGVNFKNWNLIGNPFSAYLDFGLFFNANKLEFGNNEFQAIYGYDGDASNGWKIWNNLNANDLITPGQGFFVYSKTGGGTVLFAESMITEGNADDFIFGRSNESNTNHMHFVQLEMTNTTTAYTTDFYFTESSTLNLDPGYDAALFGDNPPEFSLYSHLVQNNSGVPMAIQALGLNDVQNVTIPLGVNALQGQNVSIAISDSDIPETVSVYLDDIHTNSSHLLLNNEYTFTAMSNLEGTGRFFLRFEDSALNIEEVVLDYISVYANNENDSIMINGVLEANTSFKLYDIHGKIVKFNLLKSNINTQSIDVSSISKGIYLVELRTNSNSKLIKKLIIN